MPSKWSILRGRTVPPGKGDTQFVDLRHVYDGLPQAATKHRIKGLAALHSFAASGIKSGVSPDEAERIRTAMPGAMQPIVRISPNGSKTLFVASHAFRVEGLDDAEARR